jgi:curved DNA-binding protein CbpA
MTNPYEALELPTTASDEEIRRRYLELVRQFPPDRAPERFAAIREAYEELRDPIKRLEKQLFVLDVSEPIADIVADFQRRSLQRARIPVDILLSLAQRS